MESKRLLSTHIPQLLEHGVFEKVKDDTYHSEAWGDYHDKLPIVYMRIVQCADMEYNIENVLYILRSSNATEEIPMVQYTEFEKNEFNISCFRCVGSVDADCFKDIDLSEHGIKGGQVYPFHILENNTLELLDQEAPEDVPSTFTEVFQAYLDSKNMFKQSMLRFEQRFIDINDTELFEWNHQPGRCGLDPFCQVEIEYNYNKWFELQFPWICDSKRYVFLKLFFNTQSVKECYEIYAKFRTLRIQNIEWISPKDCIKEDCGYIELRHVGNYDYVPAAIKKIVLPEHWKRDNAAQRTIAQCLIVKYNMVQQSYQRSFRPRTEPIKVITDYTKLIVYEDDLSSRRKRRKFRKKRLPYFDTEIKIFKDMFVPMFGKSYYQNLPHLRSELIVNVSYKSCHVYIKPFGHDVSVGINRTLTDVFTKLF